MDQDETFGDSPAPARLSPAAALARAREALAEAERRHAVDPTTASETTRPVLPTSRPPRVRESREPRVEAWIDAWFRDAPTQQRVRSMARLSKGKWKAKAGWGHFSGWVHEAGCMPVRVEGFWDPPELEGSCSECGALERCVHVAALALSLDGMARDAAPEVREEEHACVPRLILGRWGASRPGRKGRAGEGAKLRFRYGPREIDESERLETLSWTGDEGRVRCARDLAAEQRFREGLDALGWVRSGLSAIRTQAESSVENALDFLEIQAPILRAEGWEVEVDRSLDLTLHPVDSWEGTWTEAEPGWFGLGLRIQVAGETVDLVEACRQILSRAGLEETLATLREGKSLTVRLESGYVRLAADRMLPILSGLAFLLGPEGRSEGVPGMLAARLGDLGIGDASWEGAAALADLRARLGTVVAPESVVVPDTLRAVLRPYQLAGLSWLQWLSRHGFGGMLADDMGLGKTLQTIAHIAIEHAEGRLANPCLVVCPTSLAPNWADEFAKFAPDLRVVVLHGSDRHDRRDEAAAAHVVVTTYSLLPRDESWLCDRNWHLVAFDEAQTLKNARTQARAVAARLPSRLRLALTGTPLENHLGELWSLFDLLVPGLLGSQRHFDRHVRPRIEKQGDDALRERLREVVSPFLLRRTKDAVASELPEKTEIVQHVELDGAQRDLYETVRAAQDKRLRSLVEGKGAQGATIQILEALLRLRQVCCDPRLLPEDMSKGCRESAKLQWVAENLPAMVEAGRRVLVFSQFTGLLDLVEPLLAADAIPYLRLDGSTDDRGAVVRDFQNGVAPVFLLSLKAGGTGLNLVAADTVVFLDPWWNPAVEAQAMDRAHRIGQTRSVFVHRLVARGTVEERILALQERKAELAASILEGGGAASLSFTADDLADLLRPLA